jgi:hypothetical protein
LIVYINLDRLKFLKVWRFCAMLKQIICDKFKTQPEAFRTELNVVLGSSDGSNAIGKSTFLYNL